MYPHNLPSFTQLGTHLWLPLDRWLLRTGRVTISAPEINLAAGQRLITTLLASIWVLINGGCWLAAARGAFVPKKVDGTGR
jgi:hypothetical protein